MELLMELENPYKIIIENGALNKANDYIKEVYKNKELFIITDKRVGDIYFNDLVKNLKDFNTHSIVIEGYEKAKSIQNYEFLLNELVNKGLKRSHMIIALGGGVIGDLAGFVASSIYRGVDFIQIPTSLLAQVDSSIGGKVAINLESGKNLAGAFYQPKLVIIDPNTLNTLPKREFSCGMAELIKSAVIGDKNLLSKLDGNITEEIIKEALEVKKHVVEVDQFDTGLRMILNFGHTFGHAIEKKYGYGHFTHGEAISIGMLMALNIGIKLGITNSKIYDIVKDILGKYDLPNYELDIKEYLELIKLDKKNINGTINLILIKEIGEAIIYKVDENELLKLL